MTASMTLPTDETRAREIADLLAWGARARHEFGFGYLGDNGEILTERGIELWITCRMTHCFALASMLPERYLGELSREEARALAAHGIASLADHFHDADYGGYVAALDAETGEPAAGGGDRKQAYAHAFVVLAASSARVAGIEGAQAVLDDALATSTERWWDEDAGMVYESYDRRFSEAEAYRGVNAAMHTVESYLAAATVTGDDTYLMRAVRIIDRVVGDLAPQFQWRFPEHLDTNYEPILDFNRDKPADPFRPYGATPGHWFEWGRLALQSLAELEARGIERAGSARIKDGALALIEAGAQEGFGVDGEPGYVYTTDFDGTPVVHERMHWVACEAFAAGIAAALADPALAERFTAIAAEAWDYIERFLIAQPGQWIHELDRHNSPAAGTWEGKPDIYHAVQALLMPDLPLAPAFAPAVAHLSE
ncbi:AGE family epimerase/isomerase [Bowdeniella nasicola]|nr:AGE family epimerase/isomerase [Bowdeniella nasicola]